MAVTFSIEKTGFTLKNRKKIRQWISEVIECEQMQVGALSYLFCDDKSLLQINQQFLHHDTFTDIVTFDYVQGGLVSGDIIISVERVAENAKKFGVPFEQELHRVIIHGVLHLLGNADKTEEEATRMRMLEEKALELWNTL